MRSGVISALNPVKNLPHERQWDHSASICQKVTHPKSCSPRADRLVWVGPCKDSASVNPAVPFWGVVRRSRDKGSFCSLVWSFFKQCHDKQIRNWAWWLDLSIWYGWKLEERRVVYGPIRSQRVNRGRYKSKDNCTLWLILVLIITTYFHSLFFFTLIFFSATLGL